MRNLEFSKFRIFAAAKQAPSSGAITTKSLASKQVKSLEINSFDHVTQKHARLGPNLSQVDDHEMIVCTN